MILRCTEEQKEIILEWVKNNVQCTKCIFNDKCGKNTCTKELQNHILFKVESDKDSKTSQLRKIVSTYVYLHKKYQEDKNSPAYGYMKSLLIEKLQLLDGRLTGNHIDDYAEFIRKDRHMSGEQLWGKCIEFEVMRGEKPRYGGRQSKSV